VARVLGRSPATLGGRLLDGGRKFACRWCACSDALHAYAKGGVHCFSRSTSATNVDLAVHVLDVPPVEALRVLPTRLGIYVPDAPCAATAPGSDNAALGR
jgi:hypothetical protein